MTWNDDVPQIPSDAETIKYLNQERMRLEKENEELKQEVNRAKNEVDHLQILCDKYATALYTGKKMNYKHVARLVHTVVREYNDIHMVPGDNFAWDDMDPDYRDSIERAVFNEMHDPAKTPAESHEKWLAVREAEGWVYGKVKNQKLKQHPCMVPYDALPKLQRFKDTIFAGMVALLKEGPKVKESV